MHSPQRTPRTNSYRRLVVSSVLAIVVASAMPRGAGQKFYDDDPLPREPETQDASKVKAWRNVLTYDLFENQFANPGDRRSVRAQNINTIDEVPDSNWFTNRIFSRPVPVEEAVRGPVTGPGPAAGPMTVTSAKPEGVTPGFVVR